MVLWLMFGSQWIQGCQTGKVPARHERRSNIRTRPYNKEKVSSFLKFLAALYDSVNCDDAEPPVCYSMTGSSCLPAEDMFNDACEDCWPLIEEMLQDDENRDIMRGSRHPYIKLVCGRSEPGNSFVREEDRDDSIDPDDLEDLIARIDRQQSDLR